MGEKININCPICNKFQIVDLDELRLKEGAIKCKHCDSTFPKFGDKLYD